MKLGPGQLQPKKRKWSVTTRPENHFCLTLTAQQHHVEAPPTSRPQTEWNSPGCGLSVLIRLGKAEPSSKVMVICSQGEQKRALCYSKQNGETTLSERDSGKTWKWGGSLGWGDGQQQKCLIFGCKGQTTACAQKTLQNQTRKILVIPLRVTGKFGELFLCNSHSPFLFAVLTTSTHSCVLLTKGHRRGHLQLAAVSVSLHTPLLAMA